MNKWVLKSIKLANSKGYLDKLFEIYPIESGIPREIPEALKKDIRKAYKEKNKIELIENLLKLPKFPIDDPYIASIRRHPFLLQKNPKTLERITNKIFSMDIETILDLSSSPKSSSRQLGHSFKKWLRTLKYPFLDKDEFISCNGIAFLEESDKKLKQFAIEELSIKNLKKGIDFILKIKNNFILGEAKFLTDYGGTQNNQFREAINITKIKKRKNYWNRYIGRYNLV